MLVTPYNNIKLVTPYYNVLICVTLSRASLLPITVLSQDSHVYRIAIEEEGGGGRVSLEKWGEGLGSKEAGGVQGFGYKQPGGGGVEQRVQWGV